MSVSLYPLYPPSGVLSTLAFYGMERSELAHNGVLHSLLSDPAIGSVCYAALIEHAAWPSEPPTGSLVRSVYQAPAAGRDRIDEQVDLDDGEVLIIEMKVDSSGGTLQCARYMSAVGQREGVEATHGLLLRLTSAPDPTLSDRIGRMELGAWCRWLTAIEPLLARSSRISRAQFAEYRSVCETMRLSEDVALKHPSAVLALAARDADSKAWWAMSGRWCLTVIAGGIAAAMAELDVGPRTSWHDFAWLGPKLSADARTAFIDCAVGLGRSFYADPAGLATEPRADRPVAVAFVKVRVRPTGVFPEVHVIKHGYKSGKTSPSAAERAAMAALSERLKTAGLAAGWRFKGLLKANAGSGAVLVRKGPMSLDDGLGAAAGHITRMVQRLVDHIAGGQVGGSAAEPCGPDSSGR